MSENFNMQCSLSVDYKQLLDPKYSILAYLQDFLSSLIRLYFEMVIMLPVLSMKYSARKPFFPWHSCTYHEDRMSQIVASFIMMQITGLQDIAENLPDLTPSVREELSDLLNVVLNREQRDNKPRAEQHALAMAIECGKPLSQESSQLLYTCQQYVES